MTHHSDKNTELESMPENTTVLEKAEWLKKNIHDSIEHVRNNRRLNQRRASTIKITSILLSGVVTILLGLQFVGFEKYFKDIAFTFGAIVTLINALEPFFNFRALWVEHELALANLYGLKDELEFYLAGTSPQNINTDTLFEFHKKYREIWVSLSTAWIRYRRGESGQ